MWLSLWVAAETDMSGMGNLRLKMLLAAVLLPAVFCARLPAGNPGTDGDSLFRFVYKGNERFYRIVVPDSLAEGVPLVMMLHGYGGKADPSRFGIGDAASRFGFVACFPQGAEDARGKTCWNVGYPFQEGLETDDVGFICALAGHIADLYGLDRRNVFCTGHSNGGEMCYLLAYLRPDVFSAVAPLAGLTLKWMYDELEAGKPVPLMEIHGTADSTSVWDGDPANRGGWGEYISVPLAVGYWAAANRCTHEQTDTLSGGRRPVIAHRFKGGRDGNEVRLYEIVGGAHSWTEDDLDTGAVLWDFFSRYVRTGDSAGPHTGKTAGTAETGRRFGKPRNK